jgi:glycosyltransferase involved in cell wall biosynthesis
MSDQPLISVITPAYRAETTLPGAVRSLLAQTSSSWQAMAEVAFLSEEPTRAA